MAPIVTSWSPNSCLAKTFNSMIGFLPVYTNYIVNYDLAVMRMNTLLKKDKFESFMMSCKRAPQNVRRHELTAYLIQPSSVLFLLSFPLPFPQIIQHMHTSFSPNSHLLSPKSSKILAFTERPCETHVGRPPGLQQPKGSGGESTEACDHAQ